MYKKNCYSYENFVLVVKLYMHRIERSHNLFFNLFFLIKYLFA